MLEEIAFEVPDSQVDRDLAEADRLGARLVIPEDVHEWPIAAINSLAAASAGGIRRFAPPMGLWVRGPHRLVDLTRQAIAMVGTRTPTHYGRTLGSEVAYQLAKRGVRVWSGAALGIDGACHTGALSAGEPTVAVLPCGIGRPYPAAHADLLARIAEEGLLVSEYAPSSLPSRPTFLSRNRLLAGLCEATVVVEALLRSGSLSTATTAARLDKTLMAIPGPVTSHYSDGCHMLIRNGDAVLVSSADEILTTLKSPPPWRRGPEHRVP
ncbi:DNA-processing protein DprA [Amycolatopsis anabasis]|uniref:DNA-processing protein DprA n=1 Tax=Amycolatopsis anabasis TaxID=1840409 RepID=UPI00131D82EF|nr:DNA-processing protein DprA [Amycolatopsis anabasis]